jgi:anti-anti-sigma factor
MPTPPRPSPESEQFRRIEAARKGAVRTVIFKDRKILDDSVLDEIRAELARVIGKSTGPDLLLDFTNVQFMSSAMLGLLGQLHRRITTGQGRLKMCNIRPQIFQVFKMTNLDRLFSIHKDVATALAEFK